MHDLSNLTALRVDTRSNTFKVPRAAFVNPKVLEAEREHIFNRCWLYLGHGSEIAKPGQYVTRTVAGRTLIFNRNQKGQVRAFLNTCPHRGATVCREKSGSAKHFQCIYHGWVFDDNGKIADQPGHDSYAPDFNEGGQANLKPPRGWRSTAACTSSASTRMRSILRPISARRANTSTSSWTRANRAW